MKADPGKMSLEARSRLEQRLLGERKAGKKRVATDLLPRQSRGEPCEPSFAQSRLWLIEQLTPVAGNYNISRVYRIAGALNPTAVQAALDGLVARHEALRTRVVEQGGVPQQVIDPPCAVELQMLDMGLGAEDKGASNADEFIRSITHRAFDLSADCMLRAGLARQSETEWMLAITVHHIAADGWSLSVLDRELETLYAGFESGSPVSLPPLPVQYADYSEWQREWLSGEVLERQLGYWRERLRGLNPLELPADRPRPAQLSYRGDVQRFELPVELVAELQTLARQHNATLYMVLLAALQVLLMRYSGQEDIAVGTPVAGRTRPELEGLIGLFVNTLVMRGDLGGNPRFVDLLVRTQQHALDAYDHQELPFEKLVEELKPERDMSRSPLFQVMFILQNTPDTELRLPGLESERLPMHNGTAKFDLSLSLTETQGALHGVLEYSSDLFESTTIARMSEHFRVLLKNIVASPNNRLSELSLLDECERESLLFARNATEMTYPSGCGVHILFSRQAQANPASEAVRSGKRSLTYRELDELSNQLARYLQGQGIGVGILVGICLERSIEMLVGLLGILKAGAAYVPLDPSFPRARLSFMADDAAIGLLLTQESLRKSVPFYSGSLLCLDSQWIEVSSYDNTPVASGQDPQDLAYVIYTSGSTGKPKGVQIPHRALTNFLISMGKRPGIAADDCLLAVTTLSFDIAALELYLPLVNGARVVLASREEATDGVRLGELVTSSGVSVMQATPSTWRLLLESGWDGVAGLKVLCGGEVLSRDLAEQILSLGMDLWNMYGPTETTIWSSAERVVSSDGPVTIGRPIGNTQLYVLDGDQALLPSGVVGELYIGGHGLARGYLNRPELTAERFVANPFQAGERLYRTGDLARYRANGSLEVIGRTDHQVKVRGYRIELGEIEAELLSHPTVSDAVVIVREDKAGDKRIVAYVIASEEAPVDSVELRGHLQQGIPDYMVPTAYVALASFPLTPNGKIDRTALPVPEQPTSDVGYQAPRTPVEAALAGIWAETLGLSRVGIHDNFFDLGGHSLLAAQTVSRINHELETAITLRQLFEAPTVGEMALAVLDTQNSILAIGPRSAQGASCEPSFAQSRLWLIEQLTPVAGNYNISRVYRIAGALNPSAVQTALDGVVARHEALRTRMVEQGGVPQQVIDPPCAVELQMRDMRPGAEDASTSKPDEFIRTITHGAFDLSADCMLRAGLARLGEAEWLLAITVHHIAADGWSLSVLDRELETLYAGFESGSPASLPPLPVQYADYAEWQREWLSGEVLERQLGYWRERLRGLNPLELPADRPRPAQLSYRGDVQRFELPVELVAELQTLARQHNATLYMVLLAALQVLLMRYSGQEDIAVGTPVAGRTRPELEGLIGLFVNTLVMRGDLGGNPRFVDLLVRTQQHALDAYDHQELPFEKLVEELKPERDMSRSPLFQVMFILQNTPDTELRLPGLESERLPMHNGTAKFDLSLSLTETQGALHGVLEYSSDLFDAARIERLARHYRRLLEHIVQAPDTAIWQLNILDTVERQMLLHDWNATAVKYPDQQIIAQRFEDQVRLSPDAVAVQFRQQSLDYAELNRRANRLAHHLRSLGVGTDSLVGLCVERSPDLLIGMLAILKAGGAYVPLDPDYPLERLNFMLEDTGATVVLTQAALADRLPRVLHLLCLDGDPVPWSSQPESDPSAMGGPNDLAYVIYTSGSTGQPKGVMVTQRGVLRLVCNTDYVSWASADVVAQISNASFDAATFEIWGALLNGARLTVLSRENTLSPDDFRAALRQHSISKLFITTALFNEMVRARPDIFHPVQDVLFGGEATDIPSVQLALAAPPERLLNVYGPTETTTFATWFPICEIAQGASLVPIGRPISNTLCHVLDGHGNLAPIGVAGELHIGGAGLARGYLNRPELTAERFITSPFMAGERLYRTGDRVRWRDDGFLEFLGRIDHQIKLRGYRIEPGEIEAVLQGDPAVRQSLAMVREDVPGYRRLVAYLVGQGIDLDAARVRLKAHLPDYMMPGALVVLDDLPLTPNGKVDRKALPVPDQPTSDEGYQAPRTPLETALAGVWADTLKIPRVGIHDDFFDLGGHSLLAVQLLDRIERVLGHKPHLNTLWYGAGNIEQQARLLAEPSADKNDSALVMRPGRDVPALFCLHTIGGGNLFHYEPMVSHLETHRPVYGLQARGVDGKSLPDTSIEAMAEYCIGSMRHIQPQGPYLLCGFSSAGLVAYEMARRLAEAGIESQLFLVDSFTSNNPQSWQGRWTRWGRLVRDQKFREIQERLYYRVLSGLGLERLRKLRGLGESHRWAMWSYRPQPSKLSAVYLEAAERNSSRGRPSTGWVPLLGGGLTLHVVPGEHGSMVHGENAAVLADLLSASLPS